MMLTRNQIIEKLFTGKNFSDCISKMQPAHLQDDLRQEVALVICEWPEEKVVALHSENKLEFYVVRVIINMLSNKYSQFFKTYRTPVVELSEHEVADTSDVEDREIREALEDLAVGEIDNLYWYDAELVRLYVKHGNFRAIEKETGIPFISCYKNIKKSLSELKRRAIDPAARPVKKFERV